jgi:hypothetical protein
MTHLLYRTVSQEAVSSHSYSQDAKAIKPTKGKLGGKDFNKSEYDLNKLKKLKELKKLNRLNDHNKMLEVLAEAKRLAAQLQVQLLLRKVIPHRPLLGELLQLDRPDNRYLVLVQHTQTRPRELIRLI